MGPGGVRSVAVNVDIGLGNRIKGSHRVSEFLLRRVVCSAGNDDLTRSSCGSGDTSIATVLGAGLVEILAVKELDTSGTRGRRLVEGDLGHVAVGPDIWPPR